MLKDKLAVVCLVEGGSVVEYLQQIQEIQIELATMNATASESEIVERIINTLPAGHDSVYTYVTGLPVLPSLADVSSRLLQAETRMKYRSGSSSMAKTEALALQFRNSAFGRPQSNRSSFGGPRKIIGPCNFCGEEGHLMRHCHELAQEMVRRPKARRQCQKLQANAVVSEVEAQKDEGCVDLFDVAINTIELEKEVSS